MSDRWLTLAKRLDALRVIPRVILLGAYVSYIALCIMIWAWFAQYDFTLVTDPTTALAVIAFPASLLSSLAIILGSITKAYFGKSDYTDN